MFEQTYFSQKSCTDFFFWGGGQEVLRIFHILLFFLKKMMKITSKCGKYDWQNYIFGIFRGFKWDNKLSSYLIALLVSHPLSESVATITIRIVANPLI